MDVLSFFSIAFLEMKARDRVSRTPSGKPSSTWNMTGMEEDSKRGRLEEDLRFHMQRTPNYVYHHHKSCGACNHAVSVFHIVIIYIYSDLCECI